jgi:hypothetical protein
MIHLIEVFEMINDIELEFANRQLYTSSGS